MQLYWGVYPYKGMMEESSTKIMRNSLKVLKEKGKVKKDDLVVFTAGDAGYQRCRRQEHDQYDECSSSKISRNKGKKNEQNI